MVNEYNKAKSSTINGEVWYGRHQYD